MGGKQDIENYKKSYYYVINMISEIKFNNYILFDENFDNDNDNQTIIVNIFNNGIKNINNPKYYIIAGIYYYCNSNFLEAIKFFQLASTPNDLKILNYIAHSYYKLEYYDTAYEIFSSIILSEFFNSNHYNNNFLFLVHSTFVWCSTKLLTKKNNYNIYKNLLKYSSLTLNNVKMLNDNDMNRNILSFICVIIEFFMFFQGRDCQIVFYDYYLFLKENKKKHNFILNLLSKYDKNEKIINFIKLFNQLYKDNNLMVCDCCNESDVCFTTEVSEITYCNRCYASSFLSSEIRY